MGDFPSRLICNNMASPDLIWALVRNNNCFIKKQKNMPVFSSEKNNLAGLNTFKYSGLANNKNANVAMDKNSARVLPYLTKSTKRSKTAQFGVSRCPKKGEAALRKQLLGYRRDLTEAAVLKYKKVLKSFKKAK